MSTEKLDEITKALVSEYPLSKIVASMDRAFGVGPHGLLAACGERAPTGTLCFYRITGDVEIDLDEGQHFKADALDGKRVAVVPLEDA